MLKIAMELGKNKTAEDLSIAKIQILNQSNKAIKISPADKKPPMHKIPRYSIPQWHAKLTQYIQLTGKNLFRLITSLLS